VNFADTIAAPNGFANTNDFHLQAGSPAFGAGNPGFNSKYPEFGNQDMGAYTTDGKGNKH
jgi:hypothetical protein